MGSQIVDPSAVRLAQCSVVFAKNELYRTCEGCRWSSECESDGVSMGSDGCQSGILYD